ncbi:iron uptake porin [Pseudanabaena yagii]|uniref:Iron uptake porin n=1 Tax=Pseudanabaena yagii GIHE-NHR1 TaxID=2722753 RepID=A0ABX1LUP2_9CYAN|nr:iron uptake porin [Pseudanabaena yagii]NMF59211.1 iron uptake porin [Pseudanabaena yagii GIHE-NHR1]
MKKVSLNLAGSLGLLSVIGAVAASPTFAETTTVSQINQTMSNDPVAQNVTSVSQLSDVKPTDWAFTALQSLVERYGCIAGYPDRTFRGKQATSRYEFAAGLNACLDKINEIISAGLADKVSKEDLATLKKLQEEFAAELATLRGRVDALDAKVTKLEAQQFSTTTKLTGEAIMAVTGASGNALAPTNTNVFVTSRVRLNLNTSFTGSDLLLTRLEVGNGGTSIPTAFGAGSTIQNASSVNNSSNIGFGTYGQDYAGLTAGSTFTLAKLRYDFNIGNDARVSIGPVMHAYDHIDVNTYANNEAYDFSSTFFINNPLHVLINGQNGGAGAAFDWNIAKSAFTLRGLYLAGNGNQPAAATGVNRGLFGDPYQATAELEFAPKNADGDKPFAIKLLYTNGAVNNATINSGGVNVEWKFAKGAALFGRYGFGTIDNRGVAISTVPSFTSGLFTGGATSTDTSLSPQTWMFGFAFPDLFKEGALAGIAVGQPLITSAIGNATQTNLELFYNFPVSSNIRITPDVQFVFNPNNVSGSTIFVGTLRTVFSF